MKHNYLIFLCFILILAACFSCKSKAKYGETITDEGTYTYKGTMEERNYNYPKYEGLWEQKAVFGDVGEYKFVGNIILKYDPYGSTHYITVIDRPIPTPEGRMAQLQLDDHRTLGCTMWFGGGTAN